MAHLMPPPIFKGFDANGELLVGGKIYTYIAGTSTPQATYTDAGELTPNTNPQILDANGEAVVWLGVSKSYKIVLTDASDVVQWTRDNVVDIGIGEITTAMLADLSVTTAKLADNAVTTVKILDANVTTAKIADNAVTPAKIPDASIAMSKLVGSTDLLFADTSDGLYGGGPRAFPRKPWESPTLIANPTSLPGDNGLAVKWSPNGKILAFCENGTSFASIFVRSGAVIRKIAAIDSYPLEAALSCEWSPNGEFLVFGSVTTFAMFQKTGTSYARVGIFTPPIGAINGIAWSPNGDFVAVAFAGTPFVAIYLRSAIFPTAAVARWTSNNGQSIANNTTQVVEFEDEMTDNAAAIIGPPWKFVARRSNGYRVSACITFANTNNIWDVAESISLHLYKNGVHYSMLDHWVSPGFGATNVVISVSGSDWVYLINNDYIDIRVVQTSGGARTLDAVAQNNYISVTEDPGFQSLPAFVQLSDPGSLPTGNGHCAAWSPDSRFLAIGHTTTPFVTIYERTGASFAKCADPSVLPAAQVNGLAWSPDGSVLTCVHGTTPFMTNYSRSNVTFTKIANPVTLPAGVGSGACWYPTGEMLAIAHDTSPYITIYTWNGSTFVKLANPTDLPASNAKSVSWTLDGEYLSVAHSITPFLTTYRTTGAIGNDVVLFVKEVNLV